jgi:hypothetical protein
LELSEVGWREVEQEIRKKFFEKVDIKIAAFQEVIDEYTGFNDEERAARIAELEKVLSDPKSSDSSINALNEVASDPASSGSSFVRTLEALKAEIPWENWDVYLQANAVLTGEFPSIQHDAPILHKSDRGLNEHDRQKIRFEVPIAEQLAEWKYQLAQCCEVTGLRLTEDEIDRFTDLYVDLAGIERGSDNDLMPATGKTRTNTAMHSIKTIYVASLLLPPDTPDEIKQIVFRSLLCHDVGEYPVELLTGEFRNQLEDPEIAEKWHAANIIRDLFEESLKEANLTRHGFQDFDQDISSPSVKNAAELFHTLAERIELIQEYLLHAEFSQHHPKNLRLSGENMKENALYTTNYLLRYAGLTVDTDNQIQVAENKLGQGIIDVVAELPEDVKPIFQQAFCNALHHAGQITALIMHFSGQDRVDEVSGIKNSEIVRGAFTDLCARIGGTEPDYLIVPNGTYAGVSPTQYPQP